MSDQTNPQRDIQTSAGGDNPTSTLTASEIAIGDLVISWYDDEPVIYGGNPNGGFTTLTSGALDRGTPVRECEPGWVAPADVPIPTSDARVTVVYRTQGWGHPAVWQLTLPGVYPSWHVSKDDATRTGLRRLAILDWNAALADATPIA